jgi:hypothetical protein
MKLGRLSSNALGEYFSEQQIALVDEQQAEVNLVASRWIEEAGKNT